MKAIFKIKYDTKYGEELLLNIRAVGSPCAARQEGEDARPALEVLPMTTGDGHVWSCETTLDDSNASYDYFYSVRGCNGTMRTEWQTVCHRIDLTASKARACVVDDLWMDFPCDAYLYSSAFTDCVNNRPHTAPVKSAFASTLRLVVRAPQLRRGARLVLTGAGKALGSWDVSRALPMTEHNYNEWIVDLDAASLETLPQKAAWRPGNKAESKGEVTLSMEFKCVALDDKGEVCWETGDNRMLQTAVPADGTMLVKALDQAFFAICNDKIAGTLVPVFSLRSAGSFGVGDFGDLKLMIDWVAETRQRLLQVLPINDTTSTHTWTDSYPYSCISIFALHPQYCDLRQLPSLKDADKAARLEALRLELNALPQIDYERVNDAKTEYLREMYAQEGRETLLTDEFGSFFSRTSHWLVPYAQYCHLRDRYGTCDFSAWEGHERWHECDRKALSRPGSEAWDEVAFYYYVQFVLDRQMRAAHDYAKARGVVLKGDIPIGVNRNGCDVWHEPEYFNLDSQAGAPPDAFSVNGQNWGFPTYNWQRMIADGCKWWVRRFQNMSHYFDAYRIDHVLGFFRIWAIPTDCVHGLLGQFQPALAMSREEIEGYGLRFQEELFTTPFIADWVIDRVFGERADEVRATFLDHAHHDIYRLKPEFDTERKIEAWFDGKTEERDMWLRDGLYSLVSDVLFVRDRANSNMYHPRITAQLNFMYEALCDNDKAAFNRLYNDYYYRRNSQFWYHEAMKKLPRLSQATRMLVCAEDLGMVPDCVPWVMEELRILSLELQSMPKDSSVKFGILSRNPYRSVCTLSTHDMPTLRQWWDEDPSLTQEYYSTMLYRGGAAPHPLPGWLARDIVARQLDSPSMLCVLSIQDWMAMDERLRLPDADAERINIPANPRHYWRYRMHVGIESLMVSKEFNDNIRELVSAAGR